MPDIATEIWAIQDLASLLGMHVANVRDAKTEFGPKETGIDVVFDLDGRRLGAQHTLYHSDEGKDAETTGSTLRAEEVKRSQDNVYWMWGNGDWRRAFHHRVLAKLTTAAKYTTDNLVAENWLVISASDPHRGAQASTLIYPELVSINDLNALTHQALSGGSFAKTFLVLHLYKTAYGWTRTGGWELLADHDGLERRQHQAQMADLIFNRISRPR